MSRASLLCVVTAAVWPVWRWSAIRFSDGSGDTFELLALATAIVVLYRDRHLRRGTPEAMTLTALALLVYAATYQYASPLVRALIAMLALGSAVSMVWYRRTFDVPVCGLLLLSLPIMPSLDFFAGYPLRAVVGDAASALLRLNGFQVVREGVQLVWGDRIVAIDAPCSGIKMLWAGAYLCFSAAAFLRLTTLRTVGLALATVVIVVGANVLRTASLFLLESGVITAPAAAHEATGLAMFALAGAVICVLSKHLAIPTHAHE